MAVISDVKAAIGDGGFSAPLGKAHMLAILRDQGATGWAVYSALAYETDFRPTSDTFLKCNVASKAGVKELTGFALNTVKPALDRLHDAGWIRMVEHGTHTDFYLNADKLHAAAAGYQAARSRYQPADVPTGDVGAVLQALYDALPRGARRPDAGAQKPIAEALIAQHGKAAVLAKIAELAAKGPVLSLAYVRTAFKIAGKRGGDPQPGKAEPPRRIPRAQIWALTEHAGEDVLIDEDGIGWRWTEDDFGAGYGVSAGKVA